jgi:hypothetical protein
VVCPPIQTVLTSFLRIEARIVVAVVVAAAVVVVIMVRTSLNEQKPEQEKQHKLKWPHFLESANPESGKRKRFYVIRIRIQKPVVTYDPRKFIVTSRARLPNYLKILLNII